MNIADRIDFSCRVAFATSKDIHPEFTCCAHYLHKAPKEFTMVLESALASPSAPLGLLSILALGLF